MLVTIKPSLQDLIAFVFIGLDPFPVSSPFHPWSALLVYLAPSLLIAGFPHMPKYCSLVIIHGKYLHSICYASPCIINPVTIPATGQ